MKTCLKCGRMIEPRKKWARNWDEIKYCSERCRKTKDQLKSRFESDIMALLKQRGDGKTICPSEVLPAELKKDKNIMEQVRQAARRLVAQGEIIITQNGETVDPSIAKGPIRLKLAPKSV